MAESEGFEPPDPFGSTVFKTAAFDHSASSPDIFSLLFDLRCIVTYNESGGARRFAAYIPVCGPFGASAARRPKSLPAILSTTQPALLIVLGYCARPGNKPEPLAYYNDLHGGVINNYRRLLLEIEPIDRIFLTCATDAARFSMRPGMA